MKTSAAVLALLLLASAAQAGTAGRLVFVLGPVEIERAGQRTPAQRAQTVEEGDLLHTGANGRTQIRMVDGSLVSLRPLTSFAIEAMQIAPERVVAPVAPVAPLAETPVVAAAPAPVTASPARAVMRLLRGGFRTISGLIGKAQNDEYRVSTPVATIGIRGTDYRALFCDSDCDAGTPNGLHVGVSNGQVVVSNGSGEINLYDDQYAYVGGMQSEPQRQLEPPAALDATDPPPSEETVGEERTAAPPAEDAPAVTEAAAAEREGSDSSTATRTAEADEEDVQVPDRPQPDAAADPEQQQSYAYASAPLGRQGAQDPAFADSQTADSGSVEKDSGSGLTGFDGLFPGTQQDQFVDARYSIDQASNTNQGFDPETGIRWGRWSGVSGVSADDGSGSDINHLHWIYGPTGSSATALPRSGTAQYSLVGNTSPTDSNGNVGSLDSASFSADFTNQSVSSSLGLTVNSVRWTVNGSGSIASGTARFGGDYSGTAGAMSADGTFAGFFVTADGAAIGAGLAYSLQSNGTSVSGAAAFGAP